jgi:transcriptional repressor NrdR
MRCPKCHQMNSRVLDSRPSNQNVRRRRECENCLYRFTTIEEIRIFELCVEKRNGLISIFSEQKLEFGIRKAFNKRFVDEEKIKHIIQKSVEDILATDADPIKTIQIGNIVLKNLKEVDEAAYICFCAMFGNFESVEDFNQLLKELL